MERRSLCPYVASSPVSEKPSVGVKKMKGLLASALSFLFASGWWGDLRVLGAMLQRPKTAI